MVDRNCPYIQTLPWEYGGEGVDHYCKASCRPMDSGGREAPSIPFCDSDNHKSCEWAVREKDLGEK